MKSRNKIYQLLSILILPMFALGQQKQKLTPKDYELWKKTPKIGEGQVSEDGQWVYYSIKTGKGDSAFVRNTKTGLQYGFPSTAGSNIQRMFEYGSWNFNPNSNWFAIRDADSVQVLNLKSGKKKSFRGSGFDFIAQTDRILIVRNEPAIASVLVHDLKSGDSQLYTNVISHQTNNDVSRVAIATDSAGICQVRVIELTGKTRSRVVVSASQVLFNTFKWNEAGNVLAFIERPKQVEFNTAEHKIYVCNTNTEKITISSFVPAASIADNDQKKGRIFKLYLSGDGKQLFFDVQETRYPEVNKTVSKDTAYKPVQIWGAAAFNFPPEEKRYNASYWYAWHADGFLENLTNENYPFSFVSGDEKNVMIYNKQKYLPQYKYINSYADIYLKERRTNNIKLLVAKVKDQPSEFMTSPTGRYIGYFKQNNWWVYDFAKDTHTCITQGMDRDWTTDRNSSTGIQPPYGSPGWIDNDQALIVYDRYDIWLISADGRSKKQITNGEWDNITFRIDEKGFPPLGPGGGNQWFSSRKYNGEKGIFITSMDYDVIENGWWWWTRNKGLEKIITKQKKIDLLSKPAMGKPLLFTEEDFDLSPRLVLRHPSGKEEIIYQTNPQQQNYYWGRSEVIRYKTIDGKDLSGALFFPANYDSTKKYPMVVEVYETRSKEAHLYIEPSESTDKSNYTINTTAYTAEGYFVLLPDISYRVNEPGISATRCVTAAVQTAIEKYSIDKNKIGLTGHSFGGYETAFIISQTDMFAAAIAGAGITDVPDFYLGISSFGTNLTRVEEDQFRMQVPFYSEAFSRNSPIHNIDKIKTPILLYTGDEDTNVDWLQSRRFQIALWRLGKKSAMLVYPGENHVLVKEENEKDLAMRMKDWFDHYLKGDAPAQWIKLNIGITSN